MRLVSHRMNSRTTAGASRVYDGVPKRLDSPPLKDRRHIAGVVFLYKTVNGLNTGPVVPELVRIDNSRASLRTVLFRA